MSTAAVISRRIRIKNINEKQSGVSCYEALIGDFYQGSFCTMERVETRLDLFKMVIVR